MNKRIAKAKATRKTEPEVVVDNACVGVAAKKEEPKQTVKSSVQKTTKEKKECLLYLQYQDGEYNMDELKEKVFKKCEAEKMDCTDLRIYVKPEDGKAYYVCAGGNSSVAL